MVRSQRASVGASTATSTFKAAAGGKMFIKLVVSELQWGRIHMSSYEENIFFNVFESAFLMNKQFWRVVENQSISRFRIFRRKFLASYARPPAQSNAMLRQRITLQVRRDVQQLHSKDEERTLHYTMTRCRTGFCC